MPLSDATPPSRTVKGVPVCHVKMFCRRQSPNTFRPSRDSPDGSAGRRATRHMEMSAELVAHVERRKPVLGVEVAVLLLDGPAAARAADGARVVERFRIGVDALKKNPFVKRWTTRT